MIKFGHTKTNHYFAMQYLIGNDQTDWKYHPNIKIIDLWMAIAQFLF